LFGRRRLGRRKGLILGLCAAVGWGGYLAATRHGIAEGFSAGDLAFIRFMTAGLVLGPWLAIRWPSSQCDNLTVGRAVMLTLLAGPPLVLFVVMGTRLTPAGTGVLIELGTMAACCIFLATWWLNERLAALRIVALSILLVRVGVVGAPIVVCCSSVALLGTLMFMVAGGMFAAFVALVERWKIEPIAASAAVSTGSLVTYSPYYLWSVGIDRLSTFPVRLIAEQIIGQGLVAGVVAITAFSLAIRLLGLVPATVFPAITPAVAVLVGVSLTGETPTSLQALFIGLSTCAAFLLLICMPMVHKSGEG